MTIYHGSILTVNARDDVVSWLVEDGGRIAYAGDELPARYAGQPVTELGQRALIPAFVDTHQHLASFSLFHAGLNVMEAASNREILDMLRAFAKTSAARLLIAFGASPYSVKERRLVSRQELDSVCPDRPVFMVKYDGHACVVNSVLLRQIDDKIRDKRGYHPDTGEMNQEAFFAVSDFVTNSVQLPELVRNMQQAVDYEASMGIGMIHTVSGVGFPRDMDISLETWFARSLQSGYQVRVFSQSLDTKTATSRHLPRIGGCFQCALDGCFGSQDAAMNAPYANDPDNTGILYYSDEKVIDFCTQANRLGLQIEMHAIGDRAFDQAARALKAALDDFPRRDHRHGIIHACLPTAEGLDICRQYHIQLPMQIAFDNWRQEPQEYTTALLGEERSRALNPVKTFLDQGCVVTFGSDGPCTDPNPIVWLDKAVNHSNPEQAITIRQALRAATYSGYWTTFDEKDRGSLEEGKLADMVILSENPYAMPRERLGELKVEQLLLAGKPYRKQSKSFLGVILGGMFSKNKA